MLALRPVSAILLCFSLGVAAMFTTTEQASSATCSYWAQQPQTPSFGTPLTPAGDTELHGVETFSRCETLVVGYTTDPETSRRRTMIQRFKPEAGWNYERISASPNVVGGGIVGGTLYDLAAYSKTNMWAVGHFYIPEQQPAKASLFVQWNGKTWSRYETPVGDPIWESEIVSVAASSSKSYWAAGQMYDNSQEEYRAAIFHWNGKKWASTRIQLPESLQGVDVQLNGIGTGPNGPPWAVGSYAGLGGRRQTLALRWNTRVWKKVDTPIIDRGFSNAVLTGISSKGSFTFASGYSESTEPGNKVTPLVFKWDGRQWKRTTVLQAGDVRVFSDVVVTGGGSWTAGYESCIQSCDPDRTATLAFNWNDRKKQWERNGVLSIGPDSRIHGMDASVNKNVWMVGSYRLEPEGPLRPYAVGGGVCC